MTLYDHLVQTIRRAKGEQLDGIESYSSNSRDLPWLIRVLAELATIPTKGLSERISQRWLAAIIAALLILVVVLILLFNPTSFSLSMIVAEGSPARTLFPGIASIAEGELEITALLAGFALTVAVMLLERRGSNQYQRRIKDTHLYRATISVFVAACGFATIATIACLIPIGQSTDNDPSAKTYLVYSYISAFFSIASILIFYGLYLALLSSRQRVEYRVAHILFALIVLLSSLLHLYAHGQILGSLGKYTFINVEFDLPRTFFYCNFIIIVSTFLKYFEHHLTSQHREKAIDTLRSNESNVPADLGKYLNNKPLVLLNMHQSWPDESSRENLLPSNPNRLFWYSPLWTNQIVVSCIVCFYCTLFWSSRRDSTSFEFGCALLVFLLMLLIFRLHYWHMGLRYRSRIARRGIKWASYGDLYLSRMQSGLVTIVSFGIVGCLILFLLWIDYENTNGPASSLVGLLHPIILVFPALFFWVTLFVLCGYIVRPVFAQRSGIDNLLYFSSELHDGQRVTLCWRTEESDEDDEYFVQFYRPRALKPTRLSRNPLNNFIVRVLDIVFKYLANEDQKKHRTEEEYLTDERRIGEEPEQWQSEIMIKFNAFHGPSILPVRSQAHIGSWECIHVREWVILSGLIDKGQKAARIVFFDEQSQMTHKGRELDPRQF